MLDTFVYNSEKIYSSAFLESVLFVDLTFMVIVGCNGESNKEQSCQSCSACNWCHVSSPKVCIRSFISPIALVLWHLLPPSKGWRVRLWVLSNGDELCLYGYLHSNCLRSSIFLIYFYCCFSDIFIVSLEQKLFPRKEFLRCFLNSLTIKIKMFAHLLKDWLLSFVVGSGRTLLSRYSLRKCGIQWYDILCFYI